MDNIKRALLSEPSFPNNFVFLGLMLAWGCLVLAFGLFGVLSGPTHLVFLMAIALGLGFIMNGTAETLPTRLRKLTVILRIAGFFMGLMGVALAIAVSVLR